MRTMEEALAWCMEHDVTVKFVTHGLTIGVQVYEYTSDIADGMTLGFGKTFLEAVQEAAGIEAQNGAQAKHDLDAEIRQVQETALTDAEVDKRIEAYNAGLAPKVDEIAALREIVKEVSEDYWVVGEVYNKCFFCGACFDEEESDHQEDCLAMRAKRLLRKSTLTLPLAEARGSRKLEVHMEIELLKKLVHNWIEVLEEEALAQEHTIPAAQILAVVQCELLLHLWEKMDSVEAGIFTVLARLPE